MGARRHQARPTRVAELVWRANRPSGSRGLARTPVECVTHKSRAGAALELPGTGPSARHAQDPPFADNVPALSLGSEKGTTVTSTVGVVVTTYNHAHFLDEALASVFGQAAPA